MTHLTYNIGDQSGSVDTSGLSAEIFGTVVSRSIPPNEVMVVSPQEIRISARFDTPLPVDVYGLRLMEGAKVLASVDSAFVVVIETPDGGVSPDATPPDSGPLLGPFADAFQHRHHVLVSSSTRAPAGTTIRVPVPHRSIVTASMAQANGADLALYQGADRLEHAWDDRFQLGTDQLAMIGRLIRDLPSNGSSTDPLVLYYGDPNAQIGPSETAFDFVERFNSDLSATWSTGRWAKCTLDRPEESIATTEGAYCVRDDSGENPTRECLASPKIAALDGLTNNQVLEVSVWLAGRQVDRPDDILYFAHGPSRDNPATADFSPIDDFSDFPPNHFLTFEETSGSQRSVAGWRFPETEIAWWRRARLRFRPQVSAPSLQYRYVSNNATQSPETLVSVDDLWVRRALEPDFSISLGSRETR